MNARRATSYLFAAALMASPVIGGGPPVAGAAPTAATQEACPDIEVVFARGTGEDPGLGPVGQEFVDALRSKVGPKSMTAYPVDYPASDVWATAIQGVRDASDHIEATAATCPATQVVLGGWSQGAAVAAFTTASSVPDVLPEGVDPATVPKPMPPEIADRVAAVVLFAKPDRRAMNFLGQPPIVIGAAYQPKTAEYCIEDDVVCARGFDLSAHAPHNYHAEIEQGAAYAAGRLQGGPVVPEAGSGGSAGGTQDPGTTGAGAGTPGGTQDIAAGTGTGTPVEAGPPGA